MKEKNRYTGMILCIIQIFLICAMTGCGDTSPKEIQVDENGTGIQTVSENSPKDTEEIRNICQEFYQKAAEENRISELETVRRLVELWGENGYPAVDSKNQIDMTKPEQVIRFCEMAGAGKETEMTVMEVNYNGGLAQYDFTAANGKVEVVRSYYEYQNGRMQKNITENYALDDWQYTKEGYFMFSGSCFSEERYVLTLSESELHTAFRVQPLDETCRELNRKYLLPVSYAKNNLFLVDWSEEDFGELDFYDLFDIFYPMVKGRPVPYVADDNLEVTAVYRIPKDEFENVIMTYVSIDSEMLQSKTIYHPEDATYEYRPRGFYETEYPEYPYPEVTSFTENGDGTITLQVHVVFPYEGNSNVYSHEVVVRPFGDGGVQYVSNRIIPSEDNCEETWHTPRLTAEEHSVESAYWFIPQAEDCLLSEGEKEQLQNEVLSAAESVRGIYQDAVVAEAPDYSSGIREFTGEQRKAVVEQLGAAGLVSVEQDTNMQNCQAVETFYADYRNGQDSMVTILEVQRDGRIGAVTFIYRKGGLQTYYIGVCWRKGGEPEIQGTDKEIHSRAKLCEL